MYTQCPECDAVYRVTSAHLRHAGGEVQCGACGSRFDALDRLSDTYPQPLPVGPGEGQPEPPAEQAPTSDPSSEAEPAPESDDDAEAAPVETGESTPDAPLESDPDLAPTESAPSGGEIETDVSDVDATRDEDAGASWSLSRDDDDDPTVNLDVTAEELFSIEELGEQDMPDIDGLEFVEGLPSGQIEEPDAADETPPGEMLTRQSSALLRWTRRIVLLTAVLALAASAVHSQRANLARNATLAPWLEGIYGSLGLPLEPAWDVSAYRIVDSAAGIDGGGDLQVTLAFVNDAGFGQPYPVLRISLEDRWGDEIGSRELSPRDYLAGFVSGQLMSPGDRTEGRATVEAPPSAAVGFRLDLCLADAAGRLTCASEQP